MKIFRGCLFIVASLFLCSCGVEHFYAVLGKKNIQSVDCVNQIDIKRAEFGVILSKEYVIDGKKNYISSQCVEVGCNEKLVFPSNIELVDQKNNLIEHGEGFYNPSIYSSKIYFSSKQKESFVYSHFRSYYVSNEEVNIPEGFGLLLPAECIILTSNDEVIYHDGYFIPKNAQTSHFRIACTQKKAVEVITIPVVKLKDNYRLNSKGQVISNCIIVCDGLDIHVSNEQIFDNVILIGSLKNEELVVEWFGCDVNNSAEKNTEIIQKNIIPSAIALGVDIYHSANGTYKVGPRYPLGNKQWGFDHSYLKDYKGITIRGNGESTIIVGCDINNSAAGDVFNIVDCKNICIRDLAVKVELDTRHRTSGINAFSLIHSNENINIEGCSVYDMPYIEGPTYPDGGKAYTIQCGPNTYQKNIIFLNNYAKNVSYGLDYTKTTFSEGYALENVIFEGNTIENAIAGVVVHEWDSPYQEDVNPVIVRKNTLSECQVGIVCQTSKACTITGNTIKNTQRPDRLRYYDGVYGINIIGAYNTSITDNNISLGDCDSFIKVGVYSFYPQYNGAVKNLMVKRNKMSGNNKGEDILVGKPNMTKGEQRLFDGVIISDNVMQR